MSHVDDRFTFLLSQPLRVRLRPVPGHHPGRIPGSGRARNQTGIWRAAPNFRLHHGYGSYPHLWHLGTNTIKLFAVKYI